MAKIWKNQIEPFPENHIPFSITQESIVERISNNKKLVVMTDTEDARGLLNIECRLHIAKDRAFGSPLAFPVPKNAAYKKDFDAQ